MNFLTPEEAVKLGYFPHQPPVGYIPKPHKDSYPYSQSIPNGEQFIIIQNLFITLIETKCTIIELYDKAYDLGLRSSVTNGKISKSKFYDMFKNPFYAGKFRWEGKIHQGCHQPMITQQQFDIIQQLFNTTKPRLDSKSFIYRGLITCGECGAPITAYNRTKKQKNGNSHDYKYYRCTHKRASCAQKGDVEEKQLEAMLIKLFEKIELQPNFKDLYIKMKENHNSDSHIELIFKILNYDFNNTGLFSELVISNFERTENKNFFVNFIFKDLKLKDKKLFASTRHPINFKV